MDVLWGSGCSPLGRREWRVRGCGTWRPSVSHSLRDRRPAFSWGGCTPLRAHQRGLRAAVSPSSPALVERPGGVRWHLVVLSSVSLMAKSPLPTPGSRRVTPVFSSRRHGFRCHIFVFGPFCVNFADGVRCGSHSILLHVTIPAPGPRRFHGTGRHCT